MSLRFEITAQNSEELYDLMVFDDPRNLVTYYIYSESIGIRTGFRYISTTVAHVPASSLLLWYRFTNEGMVIGYYANTSNNPMAIPVPTGFYYVIFYFNFAAYQMKMYVDSIDFKTYCENNFPYTFDYEVADSRACIRRLSNLVSLRTLQFKAFKALSMASVFCLPYSFFNTYKFDFVRNMYNSDGSLKPAAKWYPSMFADGGELDPRLAPQPVPIN